MCAAQFVKRIIKQCYQRAETRKSTWNYSLVSPIRIMYAKSPIHFIGLWAGLYPHSRAVNSNYEVRLAAQCLVVSQSWLRSRSYD